MLNTNSFRVSYKKYWDNDRGYAWLTSTPCMLLQTLIAAIFFNLDLPIISLFFFACMILVSLLTSKDMSPCLLPLLLVSMTVLKMYGSTLETYKSIIPIAVILIILLLFRPLYLPVKFHKGAMFWALLAVSVSITLGGLGSLAFDKYFKAIPIFYVFSLGFGMLLAYLCMRNYTFSGGKYRPKEVFTKIMLCLGLMGICMVMPVALEAIIAEKTWSIQWSNNLSTIMIFVIPFTLYQSVRVKRGGWIWFIIGTVECLATLFTLSRGGILFGFITYVIAALWAIVTADKRRRLAFIAITLILLTIAVSLLFTDGTIAKLKELIHISSNETRVELIKVAIENFKSNPIFGAGLAYAGPHYNPKEWAMYWYHSLPFQIIGSLGLVGVAAYAYIFYMRAKICLKRLTKFNTFCLISMLGFTLMGCVNPGEFAPVPFAVMITAITVFIEQSNSDCDVSDMLIINIDGKRILNNILTK